MFLFCCIFIFLCLLFLFVHSPRPRVQYTSRADYVRILEERTIHHATDVQAIQQCYDLLLFLFLIVCFLVIVVFYNAFSAFCFTMLLFFVYHAMMWSWVTPLTTFCRQSRKFLATEEAIGEKQKVCVC